MKKERFYLWAALAILIGIGVIGGWFLTMQKEQRERGLLSAGLAPIPAEVENVRWTGAGGLIAISFRGTTSDLKTWVARSPGLKEAPSATSQFAEVFVIKLPEKRIRASVLVDYSAGKVMTTIDTNDSSPDHLRKAAWLLATCLLGMIFLYGFEMRREIDS
ncbi:MAG: hypothetical protein ACPGVU_16160 [Limisphaerales bacterium]